MCCSHLFRYPPTTSNHNTVIFAYVCSYYKLYTTTYLTYNNAGMDWLCPGYSVVLARQLTAYHGNITAANTIQYVVPIVQTGDLHVAVYDLPNEVLYVANARADDETGPNMAYDRCV